MGYEEAPIVEVAVILMKQCCECCDSYEVTRSSNTIGVYIFRIKILSKDTPSFQRRDWLKNERDSEVEIRCSMSKTKRGECE